MQEDLDKILDTAKIQSKISLPVENDGYKLIGSSFFYIQKFLEKKWGGVVKDKEDIFRWNIYLGGEKEDIGSIELVSRYADEEQYQDYVTSYMEDKEYGRKDKEYLYMIHLMINQIS